MKTWLERTEELYETTRLSNAQLCRMADVGERWFYMLLDGKIKDPSIHRIQRLHDSLKKAQRWMK